MSEEDWLLVTLERLVGNYQSLDGYVNDALSQRLIVVALLAVEVIYLAIIAAITPLIA